MNCSLNQAFLFFAECQNKFCNYYFIDKNTGECKDDIKVIYPHDKMPEVDVVVVTPIMEYEVIKNILKNGGIENVISIDSIISNNVGGIQQ